MTPRKSLPTQERLRELFDYHEDGYLVRRVTVGRYPAGTRVTGTSSRPGRHRTAHVDGVLYYFHRLVYQWHHGWCPDEPDHRDRDPSNNRIGNLRSLTHQENILNAGLRTDNATGVPGVTLSRGKYVAQLRRRGTKHSLGLHNTIEEAAMAIKTFKINQGEGI